MLVVRYLFTQISTSAKKKPPIVMVMPCAITPLDHIFASVKLDTLEMGMTALVKKEVIFTVLSFLLNFV